MSYLKKHKEHSLKNNSKFSMSIHSGNSYSLLVSIFFKRRLYLYSQVGELHKICWEIFYYNRSDFMTDYIWELVGEKLPKSTLMATFHQGGQIFRQNLVRK